MDIQKYYKKIFYFCCSRIADPGIAEDVTQETFLRFLEHPEYQDDEHELQYLYTIARNLCIDAYRHEEPEPELEELPHPQEEEWIDRILLRDILQQLPEEERDIIVMRYVSGLSVREIGRIYEVSWFSMNRRIKRILGKMRTAFEKGGLE